MKIFLTSLIFSFTCLLVNAQQDRFIYLQTENRQPFFVKMNGKIYNSYPLGYLIIPKMDDGLYTLSVGFPDSAGEREFNCSINKKDVGFIIKNGGEQWQLLNLQTNNVIGAGNVITKPIIAYEKETDPFSTMLASAVHDSTILKKDVAKEILVERPAEQMLKDTVNTLASNNVSMPDTANKDLAKETPAEKTNELNQKDTSRITASITNVNIPKQDTLKNDSVKTDIAKEIIPPVSNEVKQKDSIQITTNTNVAVSQPDSVKTDIAKEIITEKSNEIKDTTQSTLKTDVAVVRSKKKIKRKSEPAVVEKDTALDKPSIQQPVFIDDATVAAPKKTRRGKKDNKALIDSTALQDSANVQKEMVKESITEKPTLVKDTVKSSSVNMDVAFVRSVIKRKSRKNSKEGLFMLYVDDNGETKDTISILIPVDKKKKEEIIEPIISTATGDAKNKAEYIITQEEKEIIKEAKKNPVFISSMINSDCKIVATDDDFLKIRKKMVAENTDEDMIKAARKIFKTKCFTTEQIKNLSVLFLKDESRYMFFEAAYPFASDSDKYSILENQLTDSNYITRFRTMIHK